MTKTVLRFKKGGEVFDVPKAPVEPDERIDKMTGLPYNQQAGTAFIDEEDRQRFNLGSLVAKPTLQFLRKALKSNQPFEKTADPKYLNLPEDQLDAVNTALSEARVKFKTDQITDMDSTDWLPAEEFVENLFYDLMNAQPVISTGLRQIEKAKEVFKPVIPTTRSNELNVDLDRARIQIEEGFKEGAAPEDREIAEQLLQNINEVYPGLPQRRDLDLYGDPELSESEIKINRLKFLESSQEKNPMFRSTYGGFETDYDVAFPAANELGFHLGNEGQSLQNLARNIFYESESPAVSVFNKHAFGGGFYNREDANNEFKRAGIDLNKLIDTGEIQGADGLPIRVERGFINVRSPLVIDEDFGNWSVYGIIGDPDKLDRTLEYIANQSDVLQTMSSARKEQILEKLVELSMKSRILAEEEALNESAKRTTLFFGLARQQQGKELRSLLKTLGFDSIKYRNTGENAYRTDYSKNSAYSYILFDPEQFKSDKAKLFDINDPRKRKALGGFISPVAKGLFDVIKSYSKRNISDEQAQYAANKISKEAFPDFGDDVDTPVDESLEEFLLTNTRALLDEKRDMSLEDIRAAGWIGDISGEEFSKWRGYTPEEIEVFERSNELADEVFQSADFNYLITNVLDEIKARSPQATVESKLNKALADIKEPIPVKSLTNYFRRKGVKDIEVNQAKVKEAIDTLKLGAREGEAWGLDTKGGAIPMSEVGSRGRVTPENVPAFGAFRDDIEQMRKVIEYNAENSLLKRQARDWDITYEQSVNEAFDFYKKYFGASENIPDNYKYTLDEFLESPVRSHLLGRIVEDVTSGGMTEENTKLINFLRKAYDVSKSEESDKELLDSIFGDEEYVIINALYEAMRRELGDEKTENIRDPINQFVRNERDNNPMYPLGGINDPGEDIGEVDYLGVPFSDITLPDTNQDTYAVRLYKDPRVPDDYSSFHWTDDGVAFHTRTDVQGDSLRIQEIQSDYVNDLKKSTNFKDKNKSFPFVKQALYREIENAYDQDLNKIEIAIKPKGVEALFRSSQVQKNYETFIAKTAKSVAKQIGAKVSEKKGWLIIALPAGGVTLPLYAQEEDREEFFEGGRVLGSALKSMVNKLKKSGDAVGTKVGSFIGIEPSDIQWANSLGKKFGQREEMDGRGDAARHLALGWLAQRSNHPETAKFFINAREVLSNVPEREMDQKNNNLGFALEADNRAEAEKRIMQLIDKGDASYMTPAQSQELHGYNKGGKVMKACSK